MPIYDTSYRRLEGVEKSLRFRALPIAATGIRQFFRKKVLFLLGLLALAPFFFMVLLLSSSYLFESISSKDLGPLAEFTHFSGTVAYAYFEAFTQLFVILFTILAGGGVIANDLRAHALEIYFSRPVTLFDYFLGKLLVILGILLMITLAPCLVLWLLDVLLYEKPGYFTEQLPLLPRLVLASLLQTVPWALLVLACSALAKSARSAMVLFAGIYVMSRAFGEVLARKLNEPLLRLLSLDAVISRLTADVLGAEKIPLFRRRGGRLPLQEAEPWQLLLVIGGVGLLCTLVVMRRVRPVEVVA